MLDRLAPLAHSFRPLIEPALDGVENMLMLPTRDPPLRKQTYPPNPSMSIS